MTETAQTTITQARDREEPKTETIRSLDNLAYWLDSAIRVPGTNWRIGFDGLIGLIPGVGDLIAGALSSYLVAQALRLGAPVSILFRMALNVLLEVIVGVIPVVGDVFDFAFKANKRNVVLLQNFLSDQNETVSQSRWIVASTCLALFAVLVTVIWLIGKTLSLLF